MSLKHGSGGWVLGPPTGVSVYKVTQKSSRGPHLFYRESSIEGGSVKDRKCVHSNCVYRVLRLFRTPSSSGSLVQDIPLLLRPAMGERLFSLRIPAKPSWFL